MIACGPRRLHCREHSFPVKALGERRAARTVLQGPLVVVSGRFVRPICEPSRFFSAIPAVPSRRKTSQMIIRLSFKHCQLLCSRHLSACGRIPQLGGGAGGPPQGREPEKGAKPGFPATGILRFFYQENANFSDAGICYNAVCYLGAALDKGSIATRERGTRHVT